MNFVSKDKLALFLEKVKGLIPKKVSELENDSKYITLEEVPEGVQPSTTTPKMNGTAATGTETTYSRGDHVHPADTTKVDKVAGKGLSTNDFTDALLGKLNGIDDNANKYTLPTAASSILGGVKIGTSISIDSNGVIDVKSVDWTKVNDRPTKLSQFTNDREFITSAVADLVNYYKKTETYTKSEVNDLVGAIKTIEFQVVTTLPQEGQSNVIYLVPNSGAAPNAYDEYAWIASTQSFEKIGTTNIDLSGYWSKEELTECTDADINSLFS